MDPRRESPTEGRDAPLRIAQWVRIRWWNACAWYAVSLADALGRIGHRSLLIAPPDTPAAREAVARGIPTPDVGDLGSVSPAEWFRSGRAFLRLLRRERIDLVNVHSGPGHARLAWLGARRGFPVVRTRGDIRPPKGTWAQRRLYQTRTAHHLAAAEFIRHDYYGKLGVPAERVTTLRGGIDLERLARIPVGESRAEIRRRLGLAEETPLVGMVGRLSPVKGHRYFLEGMARIASGFPEAHVVIAGPESQVRREDLRALAGSLALEGRTHVVGRVDDPLLWSAALDVAVIASIDSEAICRSALEFMGLGIPLVATEVHAIPEVVVPGTGILVPPADDVSLAGAIESLLASEERRASLARSALQHVRENYSLERFASEAEALFRRVLREWRAHA